MTKRKPVATKPVSQQKPPLPHEKPDPDVGAQHAAPPSRPRLRATKTNIRRALDDLGIDKPYYSARVVGGRLELALYGGDVVTWPEAASPQPRGETANLEATPKPSAKRSPAAPRHAAGRKPRGTKRTAKEA